MPRAHIRDGPTRGVRKAPTSCSPSNRPCDDVHVQSRFIDDAQVVLQVCSEPMGIGDSKQCHQEGSDLGLASWEVEGLELSGVRFSGRQARPYCGSTVGPFPAGRPCGRILNRPQSTREGVRVMMHRFASVLAVTAIVVVLCAPARTRAEDSAPIPAAELLSHFPDRARGRLAELACGRTGTDRESSGNVRGQYPRHGPLHGPAACHRDSARAEDARVFPHDHVPPQLALAAA